MEASIYCMIIEEICAKIAGRLSLNINAISSLIVSFCPVLMGSK